MPDDNIPTKEIPSYRYTAVFRDVINRRQMTTFAKSKRTNYMLCSHRFSLSYMFMI